MKRLCEAYGLFREEQGVVRVPFLIKGRLVAPPEVGRKAIEEAFAGARKDATHVRLSGAQVLREPVIDRATLRMTGEHVYQVLPDFSAEEVIERDIDGLVEGLYATPFPALQDFLASLQRALAGSGGTVSGVRELSRRTSEHPDAYLDGAFASLPMLLDPDVARAMADSELGAWDLPGTRFLDGWVNLPARVYPGFSALLAGEMFPQAEAAGDTAAGVSIRAMPTRQLHITAGNAPAVPVISALRAIVTKSAAVIKSPYGATLPGALLAVAMAAAAPDHPVTRNLSLVYWPGGDAETEERFFQAGAFDRIVVWGAPEAVSSVRSRALFTRTVCFNPRYGVSLIGKEAFEGDLETVAARASTDSLIWNQKACIASQVHYVEGDPAQVDSYAEALRGILAEKWDRRAPQFVQPAARGKIKRMRRGRHLHARWLLNADREGEFASGVVVMPGEFDILDHPMCRLVAVRRVDALEQVFPYLHHGVSTAGVYPESRRIALRDFILARGVSNVFPLGQCERMFGGMPHDGMRVLGELVDWKNG